MKQLTSEQAVSFHDSGAWKKLDTKTRALFQMEQDLLCIPFDEFHRAAEETLGRPVWTHEFGSRNRAGLLAELHAKAATPNFADIIALLPTDRTAAVCA